MIITDEIWEKANQCLENFRAWKRSVDLKTIETELPLTHSRYKYGGTIDFVGEVAGKLSLIDHKTGAGVYSDHLCQLAAYGDLWQDNNPAHPLRGGYHLLRVGKDDASFHHHSWKNLAPAWEAFGHALQLHELNKKLRKMT